MKPLYTQEEFNSARGIDKLPCECYQCQQTFNKTKKLILEFLNGRKNNTIQFCSIACKNNSRINKLTISCDNCNKHTQKLPSKIKVSKSGKFFCSLSCSSTYNNKHKTHGNKRSKLEIYVEEQLTMLYPNLPIDFNKKDTIGSELDIYIPSINLAIELNGIFHYEPIYGINKLDQIQNNDISKSKACHDKQIDLCVIDTSQQKYVKPSTSQKYLDIIINIINERLSNT